MEVEGMKGEKVKGVVVMKVVEGEGEGRVMAGSEMR